LVMMMVVVVVVVVDRGAKLSFFRSYVDSFVRSFVYTTNMKRCNKPNKP